MESIDHCELPANIRSISVVDLVTNDDETDFQLRDVSASIHLFQLHREPRADLQEMTTFPIKRGGSDDTGEGKEIFRAHVTKLPHVELQGLWES